MAKAARFKVGTSGSGKHTEVMGDGRNLGGHVGDSGPRIGAGVEGKRVRPDYDREGRGKSPAVRNMRVYSEE